MVDKLSENENTVNQFTILYKVISNRGTNMQLGM